MDPMGTKPPQISNYSVIVEIPKITFGVQNLAKCYVQTLNSRKKLLITVVTWMFKRLSTLVDQQVRYRKMLDL